MLEAAAAAGTAEELVGEADVAAHGAHGGAAGHRWRRPRKARLCGLDEAVRSQIEERGCSGGSAGDWLNRGNKE